MKKILLLISAFSSMLFSAQNISLVEFASGFSSPVEIAHANDSRLFVVQQSGEIRILQSTGTVNAVPFLNLSSKITFGGERGLLGLAFHPQYTTNGYFFVYYNNLAGNITVARYSVGSTDPNVADPTSEKILLNIPKPFTNHNGGSIHFAPDGNLWISTGDGGSGGDPNNNGQNKNSLLGKMLRIDVNAAGPYNIPPNNPFVGIDGADEVWSYGLRNAWKFSFDLTAGNAMIADVGQNQIEEINRMPISQAGINYGWRCYEGNSSYNTAGCAAASTMTFPVATYDHSGGKCSITGGYVYRGTLYPALSGNYFLADYCSTQIGMMAPDNSIVWTSAFAGNNFSTFGEDVNKELYVAAVSNGKVYKLTTTTLSTDETLKAKISISPNPAADKVFVKGLKGKDFSAEIINVEGRKVLEVKIGDDQSIDISSLQTGVYFITIKADEMKVYSQKIIVK
ncbi:MAG: PQQ-dependent sugar dehydrogenase [Kaistella sp.]|nr:PQQ-dependent sugar dehydrogenase [Kaistella sp.]